MKRFFVFFVSIAITVLLLAGCGGDQIPTNGSDADYSEAAEPEDGGSDFNPGSVAMFDGVWWYRQEDSDTYASLDIFSFEGDTAVFYDPNGNELTRGETTDNGDGTFTITLELFGEVDCLFLMDYDEWTIITTSDEAVFVQGEPIDSLAAAAGYTGKWYQNGDLEEDYLQINDDGTYGIFTVIGDESIPREEGNWELHNRQGGGKVLAADGSFSGSDFSITFDGTAMWDSDDKYYIKESLIGSVEGDIARQTVSLFAANYWAPENREVGAIYFDFHDDGTLTVMELTEDGSIENRGDGTWEHQAEDAYALTLDDGEEHTFTLNGNALTLDDGGVWNRSSYFG
jgi:hypothetical protein